MPDALDQLRHKISDAISARELGPICEDDRRLLDEACFDAAVLLIDAMAFPDERDSRRDLISRRADIDALLARIATIGHLHERFWEAAATAVHGPLRLALYGGNAP